MEKVWKITLADGTTIENLALNGNNFVSAKKITEDMFEGKLSEVTIEGQLDGQEFNQTYTNMELVQIAKYGNKYYFILREKSQKEIEQEQIKSNIDYLAMMTDVDLEV